MCDPLNDVDIVIIAPREDLRMDGEIIKFFLRGLFFILFFFHRAFLIFDFRFFGGEDDIRGSFFIFPIFSGREVYYVRE